MSGSLAPVHLEVHSSSIMSVLQSHPGSFLLLVKNLLEYQNYAPNGSICGSKWNMFNHVHTGSGFMQVQVFFFWLQSSFSWPSPWQYFEYRDQCRQDVQVDWKLSWEDLKVKLRKLFDTSEDAFNQFSMGNLVASLGPKQVKTLNWLMVIDQLAYRDWSETMITHPGNTPEPTRTWIYPPAETCGWSIRDHLALVPSSTSTVYNTCI